MDNFDVQTIKSEALNSTRVLSKEPEENKKEIRIGSLLVFCKKVLFLVKEIEKLQAKLEKKKKKTVKKDNN
jgi:hypothetical protein